MKQRARNKNLFGMLMVYCILRPSVGLRGVRRTQRGGWAAGAATPLLVLVQPQGPNKNRAVSESLRLCVDPQTK